MKQKLWAKEIYKKKDKKQKEKELPTSLFFNSIEDSQINLNQDLPSTVTISYITECTKWKIKKEHRLCCLSLTSRDESRE